MKDTLLPQPFPCTECQAGVMRPRYLTYFTWLNDELITVPNFPAWVCDVCGRREYDQRAISWLTMLLNPNTGRPTDSRQRPRPSTQKQDTPPSAPK
ncbi:MAG: YgiT-type zinc finger protein [Chloroflexi bacterium]|nr:YgiT-type zinc finger protein [Chloroflexota bacterium]